MRCVELITFFSRDSVKFTVSNGNKTVSAAVVVEVCCIAVERGALAEERKRCARAGAARGRW